MAKDGPRVAALRVAMKPGALCDVDVSEEVSTRDFCESHRLPRASQTGPARAWVMRVLLVRKLAHELDGIDMSDADEGDVLDLPRRDADLLVAEGWALPFRGPARAERRGHSSPVVRAVVADGPARRLRTLEQLRRVRDEIEMRRVEQHEQRRAEDRIREEHHDARAKTVSHRQYDDVSRASTQAVQSCMMPPARSLFAMDDTSDRDRAARRRKPR